MPKPISFAELLNNAGEQEATRSHAVSEIISGKNDLFSKFGLLIVFCLFAIVVALSWFVPYPDSVSFPCTLRVAAPSKMALVEEDTIKTGANYVLFSFPQKYYSKVCVGKTVLVCLDAYPYHEFGSIKAGITHVSSAPVDNHFICLVAMPDTGETSTHAKILYINGLKGQVRIVVKERRLFQKLFSPVNNR